MNNINVEFLKRIKNYLNDDTEYNKFINSFLDEPKTGFMLNKHKLNNNFLILNNIISDYKLELKFENDNYIYFVYNKNDLLKNDISPGKSIFHHQGVYYIQEPSANTVLRNIKFNENEKILDLCASPGGKSIQTLLNIQNFNNAYLISNELDFNRTKILFSNIERMGFINSIITNNKPEDLRDVFYNYFDKIIIDAPCSGEGMMRKNDIAIEQWSLSLIHNLSNIQKKLISDSYPMLKSGGELIYSTCTYAKEEDEEIVEYILDEYKDMKLVHMEKIYQHQGIGEGQFYAILKKDGDICSEKIINRHKNYQVNTSDKKIIDNFVNKNFNTNILQDKLLYKLNNKYYLIENSLPIDKLSKLNVKYMGALLGEIVKDRFVPSHSLTHTKYIYNFSNIIELDNNDTLKYLKGESIKIDKNIKNGYVVLSNNNISLGFAKYSSGILKNHYPKGLRML